MSVARLTLDQCRSLCVASLTRSGLASGLASPVADCITAAERDGCESHGLYRLPGYCAALRTGRVDGRAAPALEPPSASASRRAVVRVDARGGFAPPALELALPLVAAAAHEHGVSVGALRDSCHFGALWWEAERLATEWGLVALVFCNSQAFVAHAAPPPGADPSGAPPRRVYGTNPMAFAFPRADAEPLVWDQASSACARGEIQLALRDGKPLPTRPPVALDASGAPTADAVAALEGAQLPFGAHKGAMIAMMVELLAAALAGGALATDAAEAARGWTGPTSNGQLLIAIDPRAFGGGDAAGPLHTCERLMANILQSEGARLPSARRYANRRVTPTEGIAIPAALHEEIVALTRGEVREEGIF